MRSAECGIRAAYSILRIPKSAFRIFACLSSFRAAFAIIALMEEANRTTEAVEPQGAPIGVLIVDNDEALARAMEESLAKVGYECVVATSGPEGARKIETDTFDIVVTDLVMNDVDGMEILGRAGQGRAHAEGM